jgi:thymidylate synthase ThyX
LKITVAGFNIDIENCSDSPETISAAYARISRDPRPISELRASAANALEKARSSNRTIIFEYGHGSVAEHAVFNFDILDLSGLPVLPRNPRDTSGWERTGTYPRD